MPRNRKLLHSGTQAPGFSLPDAPGNTIALLDFAGSPIVISFYVADFHPVCIRQLTLLNEVLPELHRAGVQLLGISTDNVWSHAVMAAEYNLHFPLLSDFEPKGQVARAYRVYETGVGAALRATYLIDASQRVAWSEVAHGDVALGLDGVLRALEALRRDRTRLRGAVGD